jgi:hypothetical protein
MLQASVGGCSSLRPTQAAARLNSERKDGSRSGSVRISAGFRSTGFGFDAWFPPTDFWVRIPKIMRFWSGS